MSDLADEANDLVELRMQDRLAKIYAQQRTVSEQYCEDCDSEIPAARRAIGGVSRCIDCQTIHEAKQKHYK